MKVICSWCRSEGRPALLWEKAPLADARETHGICVFHLRHIGGGPDQPASRCSESLLSCREGGL
jgi:hypothetical protein